MATIPIEDTYDDDYGYYYDDQYYDDDDYYYYAVRSTARERHDRDRDDEDDWWELDCWESEECWDEYEDDCWDDDECWDAYLDWEDCYSDDYCEYYDDDEWDEWDGCWGKDCEVVEIPVWHGTGIWILLTWYGLFSSWAYYQSGWFLHDIQWYLQIIALGPFNLFISSILVIATAFEREYMEVFYGILATHVLGLFIYLAFLGTNLAFYRMNEKVGPVEEWEENPDSGLESLEMEPTELTASF